MRAWPVIGAAAGIVVAAAALASTGLRRFTIRESSMSPTLESGDWIVAKRGRRPIERGAIVIFPDPDVPGRDLVKRVIGLPGEHVSVLGGRVTVDGSMLADRWGSGPTRPDGSWAVPAAHVWVLGDNRGDSASDGRTIGATALADIGWIVVGRYHPFERAGRVE